MNEKIEIASREIEKLIDQSLGKEDRQKIFDLLHQLLSIYYIPPPPSLNPENSNTKEQYYEFLHELIISRFLKPFEDQVKKILPDQFSLNGDVKSEVNNSLASMFSQIENDYEKRLDTQPVFKGIDDTETLDLFQSHPSDLSFNTIQLSSVNLSENSEKNILGVSKTVDVTKEIQFQATVGKRRLHNNKNKFRITENNPFRN